MTPAAPLRAPSPVQTLAFAFLAGGALWATFLTYLFGRSEQFTLLTLLIGFTPFLVLLPFVLVRRKVTAGFDGVHVRWFSDRFFPYGSLMRARPLGNDSVALLLRGGGGELIARGPGAKALLDRVWAAMEARAHQVVHPAEVTFLERGSRTVAEWLAAVSQLGSTADPYRGAAMSRDRLWAVVENPVAPAELRAAAAAALAPVLDPPARQHLRVVASEADAPALREAITAAVDGDAADRDRTFDRLRG